MLVSNRKLAKNLEALGVSPGDTIFVHVDAAVCSQYYDGSIQKKVLLFIEEIVEFLGPEGTLLVPTFSYGFTKGIGFDRTSTKSENGMFSSIALEEYGELRTGHPVFSALAFGRHASQFRGLPLNDCFGSDTIFGLMFELDAKVLTLGCPFKITFTHYVEQIFGVRYRFFKYFEGSITSAGVEVPHSLRYFVGDPGFQYRFVSEPLVDELKRSELISIEPFGRFAAHCISSQRFTDRVIELLKEDEFFLIEEGHRSI